MSHGTELGWGEPPLETRAENVLPFSARAHEKETRKREGYEACNELGLGTSST